MSHNPLKGGTLDRDNQMVGPSGTKAALDTIAAGGSVRGSICFATDEQKYYFVNSSDILVPFLNTAGSAGIVSTKTTDYTITDVDDIRTVLVSDTSSDRTITLPTVADNTDRIITVKNTSTDGGKVILDGEGSETIDGYLTIELNTQNDSISVTSDGLSWKIVEWGIDVSARYTSNAGQNNSSGAFSVIKYEDKAYDTHLSYDISTGLFTAKYSGKYAITGKAALTGVTSDTGEMALLVYKQGAEIDRVFRFIQRGTIHSEAISTEINLAAGETCAIYIYHTNGAGRALIGVEYYNVFTISLIK